ncbi:DUF488 family protein [Campylobacterota bacterium]
MKLYTIGFSGKSAEDFFELLKKNSITTLIDARLNNKSQLAGFTKVKDFPYLLDKIAGVKYLHATSLAPTKELLNGYRDGHIDWQEYEITYDEILQSRSLDHFSDGTLDNGCILCSEPSANQCHRRLAAEYLQSVFPEQEIEIIHL